MAHAKAHRTGNLTISLQDVLIRKNRVLSKRLDSQDSAFVKLSVGDPLSTTIKPGHGTGMGLSVCLGMIRRFSGWITVESEIGKEDSFHVFLPIVND